MNVKNVYSNIKEVYKKYINDRAINLCKYLLISICRIMTYEKILDIRMKFMNNNSDTEYSYNFLL